MEYQRHGGQTHSSYARGEKRLVNRAIAIFIEENQSVRCLRDSDDIFEESILREVPAPQGVDGVVLQMLRGAEFFQVAGELLHALPGASQHYRERALHTGVNLRHHVINARRKPGRAL